MGAHIEPNLIVSKLAGLTGHPLNPVKPPEGDLVRRTGHAKDTVIHLPTCSIGGPEFTVIAGPCSVENEQSLLETAGRVCSAGAGILRGGAFKPRTSPYSFQGLEDEGLQLLDKARQVTGLPIVTEIMDSSDIPLVAPVADILQVGARNCQNTSLLKKLGRVDKPILLKRGLMLTIDEFLNAAEYILASGNPNVILCERGIRTFEVATRNTLDLSAVVVLKEKTHLPVIVDPSHAVGRSRYVAPLAKAAMAVGADGLMVEVHAHPEQALCDGDQSLTPDQFDALMDDLRAMSGLVGRRIGLAGAEKSISVGLAG